MEIVTAFGQGRFDQGRGLDGGIVRHEQRARFIVQLDQDVQVPAARAGRHDPRIDGQPDGAAAGDERKHVHVSGTFQHPLVGRVGVVGIVLGRGGHQGPAGRDGQGGGRSRRVAVVVGAIRGLARDRRHVVLRVVREIVFALAPLADVAVVAGAHDRAPGDVAAAVAAVVLGAVGLAVVTESQVVPDLVGSRLGDVGLVVGKVVVIDPCGPILGVRGRAEDVHVGHAAGVGVGIGIAVGVGAACDQCVSRAGGEHGGPLGGDIDVEGGVVLRHALPDALDGRLFGVAEGGPVGIRAEGQGGDLRTAHEVVPFGVRHVLPGEVQVENVRRARPAVEDEMDREGADRHRRLADRGRLGFGRSRGRSEVAHVEDPAARVGAQRGQVQVREMEAPQPSQPALPCRPGQPFQILSDPRGGRQLIQTGRAAQREVARRGLRGGRQRKTRHQTAAEDGEQPATTTRHRDRAGVPLAAAASGGSPSSSCTSHGRHSSSKDASNPRFVEPARVQGVLPPRRAGPTRSTGDRGCLPICPCFCATVPARP